MAISLTVGSACRWPVRPAPQRNHRADRARGPSGHHSRTGRRSACSCRRDMSWLAEESVINNGTPSFGGNSHRHSAPMAENPNPDKPLMMAESPRMPTRASRVVSEYSFETTASTFKINTLARRSLRGGHPPVEPASLRVNEDCSPAVCQAGEVRSRLCRAPRRTPSCHH